MATYSISASGTTLFYGDSVKIAYELFAYSVIVKMLILLSVRSVIWLAGVANWGVAEIEGR
jgi:hypothetical protein